MGVMVSSHARKIFAWLELIVMKDLPISYCDDEIICKYISHEKVYYMIRALVKLTKCLDQ